MVDGIVLLDKEWGVSSAGALNKLKWIIGEKKVGHAGTLDPAATGLLICLFGRATKLADFVQEGRKIYSGTILFGVQTDSDDITGSVIATSEEIPSFSAVEEASRPFVGTIQQLPPSVSALKVKGRRAYDLVREGITPDLKTREVHVSHLSLSPRDERRCDFIVHCSKGTYIRSLARDLGAALGCGATLDSLRREASVPFSVADAKTLSSVSPMDVRPWWELVGESQWIEISEWEDTRISHGDERFLPVLLERAAECLHDGCRMLGYKRGGVPRGVLLRRGEGWSFGPYFGSSEDGQSDTHKLQP